jgi:dTDP-4-amino-4,6-dideoxygalactose transaminase
MIVSQLYPAPAPIWRTFNVKVIPAGPAWLEGDDYRAMLSSVLDQESREDLIGQIAQELRQVFDRKHVILTSSGRTAIFLALRALGIPQGAAVAVPAFTCVAVPSAILACGLVPRFLDAADGFNMAPDDMEKAAQQGARAVIATHLYGIPCDIDAMVSLSRQYGMSLVEDACLAVGSTWKGQVCGSFGDVSVVSFSATKHITGFGGGALLTDDDHVFERASALWQELAVAPPRNSRLSRLVAIASNNLVFHPWLYGNVTKRLSRRFGVVQRLGSPNVTDEVTALDFTRLLDVQLALLHARLSKLPRMNEQRTDIASTYDSLLSQSPFLLPRAPAGSQSCYSHYTLLLRSEDAGRREQLRRVLFSQGVMTGMLFPYVCPLTPAYGPFADRSGYPLARDLSERVLNLPFYPQMGVDVARDIAERTLKAAREVLSP